MDFSTMDIFDLFMVHEDGYTNLLKYLFDNSNEFKIKFTKLLFNENNLANLKFNTRTAYLHHINIVKDNSIISKKSVPDIIVYDSNHFCIIEVKVYEADCWCNAIMGQ